MAIYTTLPSVGSLCLYALLSTDKGEQDETVSHVLDRYIKTTRKSRQLPELTPLSGGRCSIPLPANQHQMHNDLSLNSCGQLPAHSCDYPIYLGKFAKFWLSSALRNLDRCQTPGTPRNLHCSANFAVILTSCAELFCSHLSNTHTATSNPGLGRPLLIPALLRETSLCFRWPCWPSIFDHLLEQLYYCRQRFLRTLYRFAVAETVCNCRDRTSQLA